MEEVDCQLGELAVEIELIGWIDQRVDLVVHCIGWMIQGRRQSRPDGQRQSLPIKPTR